MSGETGQPTRPHIPLAKPFFSDEEFRLVAETIQSGWVTQGPRVAEFESAVADYVGATEAVAVSSGTAGLFLSLKVLGVGPGDEVIVPSLSFIATANAIIHVGADPVFVDIDPRTFNIDPTRIESAVTSRTRAIIPVDQLGMPAMMDEVRQIASRRGVPIVEDAACALGSRYRGRHVGQFADLTCFSFHPRKIVVAGEGGMITTNDRELASRLRRLRHQGMMISDLERHRADRVLIETYPEVGYNFRLSDVQAAIGIAQMAKLELQLAKRRAIANRYAQELAGCEALELPRADTGVEFNYQSFLVRFRGATRTMRNNLMNELHQRRISTRRGVMAIHREACYESAKISGSLEHTEAAADQTMNLPMYAELAEDDQSYVIDQLLDAVAQVSSCSTEVHGSE